MSRMKFYSYNWIVQDATELIIDDPDNLDSFFPLSNLKHSFSTKVFRSKDGVIDIKFIIDCKTNAPVDAVMIKGHCLDGLNINSVLLEGSGTLDFSSPGLSKILTLNHEFNFGYNFFTEQSFRYYRITLNNTSDFCEIGNIFLGKSTYLENNNIDYNWKFINLDRSKINENRYGQRFIDKLNSQKVIECIFNYLNKNEFETMNEIFEAHGKFKPLWIVIDPDSLIVNNFETFAGQFYFDKKPEILNVAFGLFQASMSLIGAT